MIREERLVRDEWQGIEPILFYRPENAFGCLSMFSAHPIILPDPWTGALRIYEGGEWRFQALKGQTQSCHDYVCEARSASAAKWRGGPKSRLVFREDWGDDHGHICWYVMLEACLAKALQHVEVQDALSATGERLIYEDSPSDAIWGWRDGKDYCGKNLLGRAWMQTRAMIL